MKKNIRCYLYGYFTTLAVMSLFQDTIGKERYLAFAQEHWVDGAISVPIAVIVLLLCSAGLWRED